MLQKGTLCVSSISVLDLYDKDQNKSLHIECLHFKIYLENYFF